MTFKFCSSGAIVRKAGANVDAAAAASGAILEQLSREAEAYINMSTNKNWNDEFDDLPADLRPILEMAASSFAGKNLARYKPSSYEVTEIQVLVNMLDDDIVRGLEILKEQKQLLEKGK